MDSVDYLQFVNSNAQRSDQGVASLMQALQYRQQKEQQAQQMQRQQEQDAQAKQLHDLQVAKLQEEQQYQQGLKAAMAAPPTTSTLTQTTPQPLPNLASLGINTPDYVPPPSAAPDDSAQSDIAGLQSQVDKYPGLAALSGSDKRLEEMKAASPRQMVASTGSLAGLLAAPEQPRPSLGSAPEFGAQPPQVQAPMLPGVSVSTETQSPYQAGAEYAAKNGRTEEATKFISLNAELAKQAAQAKAYGSPEKAAEIEAGASKMVLAAKTFSELKKAGGMQYAMAAVKQQPGLFGNIDLTKLADKGNINTYDLPNGQQVVWSDDNPGQIHLSAAPKEFADKTQIVEIPSPNGKTAQKYRVNVDTGEKSPLGAPYAVKSQVPNVNVITKGSDSEYDPETVDVLAQEYLRTGKMPALGNRSAGARKQILTRYAQLVKGKDGTGTVGDVIVGRSDTKDLEKAKSKLTVLNQANQAFEKAAVANSQVALNLAQKYGREQLPIMNKIRDAIKYHTGDSEVMPLYNSLMTASREYMKVTSGGGMSAAELSVGAQKKAEEILGKSGNLQELTNQLGLMKTDMGNFTKSQEDQLKQIRESLRTGGNGSDSKPANAGTSFIKDQYTAYRQHGLPESEIQGRIYQKLKAQKWSDSQIAAAWQDYKGGR